MEELLKSLIYPAVIAAVAAGLSYIASRRIQNADVAAKYQDIARKQAEDNIRLEKCQDELEKRITDLEKVIRGKDERIATLDGRVGELETALRTKDDEIAVLKGENTELNGRVSELEKLAGNLETENATLKAEIEALQRRRK